MNTTVKWSIAGSVLILAMLLAIVPGMLRGEEGVDKQSGSAQVAARPDCPAPVAAGVELPCLGGEALQTAGKVTVVNVWAWWCEPCRDELPLFDQLAAKHPEWQVVGVHADPNAANGAAMLGDLGIQRPSYQDSTGKFAGTLALPGVVPITLVVRADGTVAAKFPKTFSNVAELETAVQGVI